MSKRAKAGKRALWTHDPYSTNYERELHAGPIRLGNFYVAKIEPGFGGLGKRIVACLKPHLRVSKEEGMSNDF